MPWSWSYSVSGTNKVRKVSGNRDLLDVLYLAQRGSAEALGELLEGCRQYLLLVANAELDPKLRAKVGGSDIVQDTMLAAQQHFVDFRSSTEAELLAWLRRILLNRLEALRRQYFQTEKRCLDRELSLDGRSFSSFEPGLVANTVSPSSHAIRREEAQLLDRALSRLPERDRLVIQLRHIERLSFEQIARQLDLSTPATRQLWGRCIQRLQRELKDV